MKFFGEYGALMRKMFLLTKRKRTQTIIEFLLAYIFLALLLAMRFLLDPIYKGPLQLAPFRPYERMSSNSTRANLTFYWPDNVCTRTIMNSTMSKLTTNVPGFPSFLSVVPNTDLTLMPNSTVESIYAYVIFTNVNASCTSPSMMPDQVHYTIRMQENGLNYYRVQQVKLRSSDVYWKRSPEDYCQENRTWVNYTTQFLGVQYFLDLSIIEYVTSIAQSIASVSMTHFGCPAVYLDNLHGGFAFFVPLFYAIIYLVTFVLNVGYIVEERANKTKEYLRIFGLRTWVNNFVWITRSMLIYFILTLITSGLSIVSLSSDTPKAVFNYVDWTVVWTILFVYSFQVSTFAVFFGQLFKRVLLAKLIGIVFWIITFIDFYGSTPVAARYILCFLPNTGLLFCIQIMQQFERRNRGKMTYGDLYSNIFDYPTYVGIYLLMMLIYGVIYILLAVYVERINPGEFGVAQKWNYFLKKSYWNRSKSSAVQPSDLEKNSPRNESHWIEMNAREKKKLDPSLVISHLNKRFGKFQAVNDLCLEFYPGEVCSLLGHNGAGKTTTTFILVGMLEASSGTVTIEGLDNRTFIEEVRQNLGFCPQYDILYDDLSVEEHLQLIAKMRHMSKEQMKESIEEILDLIGLKNDRSTLSKNLSGGMKRRLSIGISLVNNPKVIILDEPTSGIDPYNRRLIWTIVRKLKAKDRCVLLTTHFLEEADVLSDRIAIMSRGALQANGTPDFLKQQTEFEYRLLMDKDEKKFSSDRMSTFLKNYIHQIRLERESVGELIYGIKRGQSKEVERLIENLDQNKDTLGIKSYGLSMATIEDVFLKLIEEEEEKQGERLKEDLTSEVFGRTFERLQGFSLFRNRFHGIFIKRWHLSRRDWSIIFGFLFLSLLIEILCVAVVPTPQEIQSILLSNERINDAQIQFRVSMYNPQTIVTYFNENQTQIRSNLLNYLTNEQATIDEINQMNVSNYVRARYLETAQIFLNRYQMGFATMVNGSSIQFNSHFSTVNYHTMPTSLSVATNQLFRFYTNSTSKAIFTNNQPIITPTRGASYIAEVLSVLYCFEVFPVSLFSFLNSLIVTIFIAVLLLNLITERITHSKDLQLLTNLSRKVYWFSHWSYDVLICLVLCALLTIIVKIGAEANPKNDAEVRVFQNGDAMGCFFLLFMLYVFASLPLAYAYSFRPRTSIIGLTNFFILNAIINVIDAVINSAAVFRRNDSAPGSGTSQLYRIVSLIRWIFAALLPSVNLKQGLANIQLHERKECITIFNRYIGTSFALNERWGSFNRPGIGAQMAIFIIQSLFWSIVLIIVESRPALRQCCRGCCSSDDQEMLMEKSAQWNDTALDDDVRRERRSILENHPSTNQAVILVRDLIKQFRKRRNKSSDEESYLAVNHLNFYVQKKECFGLLGANGAGKTTTFRMLVNDMKPTSGEILIDGKNINEQQRLVEIGFCPQFDWLIDNLSVKETLMLFARLKGIQSSEIEPMCENMMKVFGLDMYRNRRVQRLSGGNKRKVSAAIAFMANPALVFLDEPTTGLDAAAKRKLWKVIRSARDLGLTIIMTSHSMEECEALCTKLGIMKTGQFMCLGTLQHLRNRFSTGYAVQIKASSDEDVNTVKRGLANQLSTIEILEQHNEMLFCNIPFAAQSQSQSTALAQIFQILNRKKEEKLIETYALTQTTLEQIFVQLAGEDEDATDERQKNQNEQSLYPTLMARL